MNTFIVTCALGLEAAVKYELINLGYSPRVLSDGRIEFTGEITDMVNANIWLRCANRVLIKLFEGPALEFEDVFQAMKHISWGDYLNKDAKLNIRFSVKKSKLSSVPALQSVAKKAAVEVMQAVYGLNTLPETGYAAEIFCYMENDNLLITLDTSGEGLFKRGYRLFNVDAPIKENLASGILSICRWKSGMKLWDPFCGGGTFCIEAAMQACSIAPGLMRDFAFMNHRYIEQNNWEQVVKEAKGAQKKADYEIVGSDISEKAIEYSRKNAHAAGVKIDFRIADALSLNYSDTDMIISNLPYGKRIQAGENTADFYRALAKYFTKYRNAHQNFLTDYDRFDSFFFIPPDAKKKLMNGKIQCRLFMFRKKGKRG